MAHMKRHLAPKRWPINRKGTTFVVNPKFNPKRGIPVLIILRDILKVCQNRKEAKKAINAKKILLNNKPIKKDKNSALLFDTISLVPSKKYYRICLSIKGKYDLEEISEKELNYKISKIIDKKIIKGKKVQFNLRDGNNFLSDLKCKIGDSVLIDFKNKKIEKCFPLKDKVKIIIIEGKYAGKKGIIEKLKLERKIAKLNIEGKEVNVLIKQIMVVE
jgi:small subunit ribosomal protein S4e